MVHCAKWRGPGAMSTSGASTASTSTSGSRTRTSKLAMYFGADRPQPGRGRIPAVDRGHVIGYRESEQSSARAATGDPGTAGSDRSRLANRRSAELGFWGAVRKVFPKTRVTAVLPSHKTANVLQNSRQGRWLGGQPKATAPRHLDGGRRSRPSRIRPLRDDVYCEVPDKEAATTCLAKDRGVLLTFYKFPAEHWMHIRTTNPIESTFATVRIWLTHEEDEFGAGSRLACLTMVFKLALRPRRNNGEH